MENKEEIIMSEISPHYTTDISTLYCGDCVTVMEELIKKNIKVNKVITSPPYNIIRPTSNDRGYDLYKDGMANEEYIDWLIKIFNLYDKIIEKQGAILFNMNYGTENTVAMNLTIAEIIKRTEWTLADIIVWKKQCATPNNVSNNKFTRICEFIYVFCRKTEFNTFTTNKKIVGYMEKTNQAVYENIYNFIETKNNDGSTELNKATFSTDLVGELIRRYVLPNDVVLDNFSGTGTTMVACEQFNIKNIGIELSLSQCDYTIQRLKSGFQLKLW